MTPIGLLMKEHRVIERMIQVMGNRMHAMREAGELDVGFIDTAIDFARTYADQTHHGKEEDILFRALEDRSLSDEHRGMMNELIEEHVYARKVTGQLAEIRHNYLPSGDMLGAAVFQLSKLIQFYPEHIRKEDKVFFPAAMDYLSEQEQKNMLDSFFEFDREMIHRKYRAVVEALER
ncbi:MAG: cation-binding protein [Chitinivibrionales bacterium]|nr:cation-binding protein [Chitinivibrionales bacterium]